MTDDHPVALDDGLTTQQDEAFVTRRTLLGENASGRECDAGLAICKLKAGA